MPCAPIDVVANRPIRRRPGPVAEVRRPASQNLIQPIAHLRPCPRIAWYQMVSHFLLDACHALLGRTCSQIPTAFLLITVWPERVTQKGEAFFARLLDAGFRLIQSESQPCDHLPRPIQCFRRFSATENHEIVRIGSRPGLEFAPPFCYSPTLTKTVSCIVGQTGGGNPPLGEPRRGVLPRLSTAVSRSRPAPLPGP